MSVSKKDYVVALVDDCADVLDIMTMMLNQAGYHNIISAGSALDALKKLASLEHSLDAIITDYYLGDGTGTDVVSGLMMAGKSPDLRILVSGYPNVPTSHIFHHMLLKPISANALTGILDAHFTHLNRKAS
jgi:DNA-binding NtrC family response regulator